MNDLSYRERTIARLVSEGHQAKEIGTRLGLAEQTIKNAKSIIYAKLGVRNAAEMTRALIERNGL